VRTRSKKLGRKQEKKPPKKKREGPNRSSWGIWWCQEGEEKPFFSPEVSPFTWKSTSRLNKTPNFTPLILSEPQKKKGGGRLWCRQEGKKYGRIWEREGGGEGGEGV
jgi:hypothetical protein